MEGLRRHVPLFKNRLPVGGPLADELADRLNTMLAARGVAGHAHYLRFSDSPDSPIQSFLYSVDGADITIRNVDFPGASPSNLPILHDIARKKIEEGEYLRSKLEAVANVALRPIYLRQGYLKAAFGEAQAQVVSMSPKETVVDVKLPVEEGPQYKLDKIVLAGNTIFAADELRALIHLELNQAPDVVQIEDDFRAVQKLYGSRGYLKAVVTSRPEFNDSEGTVTYKLQVKEGDLYRLAEVDIEGFDEKTVARLREDWKLREGDPYDSSYPQRFFQEAVADMPASNRWAMKVDESLNDKDKTVDVTLRFSPE
jgi:outer membrane protein assembly factor BamA